MANMTIPVSQLVCDCSMYPRHQITEQHVSELAEALRAGAVLPPIIAEEQTFRIIDGVHRSRAYVRVYGPNHPVAVVTKTYASEKEFFLDCVRLNAGHGRRLSPFDVAHCMTLAEKLSIDPTLLSEPLTMTVDALAKIRQTKTALDPFGKPLPIRRSLMHLAGTQFTEKQVVGAQSMSGMSLLFHVNQLITAVEHGFLPSHHPALYGRLAHLAALIAALPQQQSEPHVAV